MDPILAGYLQRDEELMGVDDEAHKTQIEGRLREVHTCLPGIILSFDPQKQTVQAQPAIQRIFISAGAVNLPPCVDVPVSFPGGGGMFITFPVAEGDECILHFSERCIDYWYTHGGVQLPAEYRLHDLSDAFAYVGVNSQPNALADYLTNGCELRSRDRSIRVSVLASGEIDLVNGNGNLVLAENGDVTISGNLTVGKGATITEDLTVDQDVNCSGTVTGDTDVIAAGKSGKSHLHMVDGVQTGTAIIETGEPQ